MNVFLALSLILIFYYLFMLHDNKNKNYIEKFSGTQEETTKLLTDINVYLDKRITNSNSTIKSLKAKIKSGDIKPDKFIDPVVINKHVETNETKIMSDSPTYIPTNLYVNGAFVINNNDKSSNNLSKNLCMGENCYSEQDLLYIIQDLLPYYKYDSDRSREIKELCFENYDTINTTFELPALEPETVLQGLDYKGQLLALREIVKEYDLELANLNFSDRFKKEYNIHVGGHNSANAKTITLPEEDMTVSPIPTNTQNPSWGDKFSVSVTGKTLSVTRIDSTGGWGQNLYLKGTVIGKIPIYVGVSSSNTKKIKLPFSGMRVDPTPVNTQDPSWNDRFSVSVSGRDLTVKRLDSDGGWGQKLVLNASDLNQDLEKNVILLNSYRTDYNLINFLEKYPSVMDIFFQKYNGSIPTGSKDLFIKTFREEALSNYESKREIFNSIMNDFKNDNCINGEDLKMLTGEKAIKLTSDDEKVYEGLKVSEWERWHANTVDSMREWFKIHRRGGDFQGGFGKAYDDPNIYHKESVTVPDTEATDKPYLNEQHFEVHGTNDDDNDCMVYRQLKTATMSKSKKGNELQRNGVFEIEKVNGKSGETGVFCKPE